MPLDRISEQPSISLRSNWLTVGNSTLRADILKNSRSDKLTVSTKTLESLLVLGRSTILQAIEDSYVEQTMSHLDSTVIRPSIWTTQLGTTTQTDGINSKVFNVTGYRNGGVNTTIDELQPRFQGHWSAVKNAGFLPEVRRTSGTVDSGSWLLLRKPTIQQVALQWLEWQENPETARLQNVKNSTHEEAISNLHRYQTLGEARVDHLSDTRGNALRPRFQIGLLLGTIALKQQAGYPFSSERDIDDILDYATESSAITTPMIRAIVNSTF